MTKKTKREKTGLIALEHCSVVLDGRLVLDDVTFALNEGQRWALIGKNGSGKTLLLKLLRGDMWPTPDITGQERREYSFDGETSDQPHGFKERIAYIGPERQDRYVRYGWNHTASQIVTTGLFDEEIPRTKATPKQKNRVVRLLKQFKVWSLRERGFLTLSYGQRRRVLFARALAGNPEILLLDEVFNGLDAVSAGVLRQALNRRSGIGATWILTTHRAQDVPKNVTHRARIAEGRLQQINPSQLHADRKHRFASPSPQPSPIEGEGAKSRRGASRGLISAPSPLAAEGWGEGALVRLCNVDLYRDYRLVLRDVNWTIHHGEHWAIFGANGSGKSTLLKLLYGDLHPRLGGTIERDGVPFGTPIIEWKARVGFVSPELQADYFLARDLEEVVMSGRYSSVGLNDRATRSDRKAARHWLKFFALESLAHRGPRAVSYGQMRRALLARAMINDPELLLLDEPMTGLDPDSRAEVLALLERLAKHGVQLVMAVHARGDLPPLVTRVLSIRRDRTLEVR